MEKNTSEELLQNLKKIRQEKLKPINMEWMIFHTTHGVFEYVDNPQVTGQTDEFVRIVEYNDKERTLEKSVTVIYIKYVVKSVYKVQNK